MLLKWHTPMVQCYYIDISNCWPTEYAALVFILKFWLGSEPQLQINSVSLPLTNRKLIGKPTPRSSKAAGCLQDGSAEIQSTKLSDPDFSAKVSRLCHSWCRIQHWTLLWGLGFASFEAFCTEFVLWLAHCSRAIDRVNKFQGNCWSRLCFFGPARWELGMGFSRSSFSPVRAQPLLSNR